MEALQSRPIAENSLVTEKGYICPHCDGWERLYLSSPSLEEKRQALARLKPGSPKHNRAMSKFQKKFNNLQREFAGDSASGESGHVYLAQS